MLFFVKESSLPMNFIQLSIKIYSSIILLNFLLLLSELMEELRVNMIKVATRPKKLFSKKYKKRKKELNIFFIKFSKNKLIFKNISFIYFGKNRKIYCKLI
jgi:hypothetical protein